MQENNPKVPEIVQEAQQGNVPKLSPKEQREIDSYSTALKGILYDKKAGPQIYDMLKKVPPEKSIPQAVLLINSRMETALKDKGKQPKLGVVLYSNIALIQELMTVGKEGGFFEITEEQMPQIMQTAFQAWIEKGLKDKTIDPIELQKAVEPMLSKEQREKGQQIAKQGGLPMEPGAGQAMEQYANKKVSMAEMKMKQQQEAQQNKGAMQQTMQPQQGGV